MIIHIVMRNTTSFYISYSIIFGLHILCMMDIIYVVLKQIYQGDDEIRCGMSSYLVWIIFDLSLCCVTFWGIYDCDLDSEKSEESED